LQTVSSKLVQLAELDTELTALPNMIEEAMIQLEEANTELRSYLDKIDVDPERMAYVEERFSKIMSLARKHHVMPEELYQHHQDLLGQIEALDCSDEKLAAMEEEV
ncbi:DNA repair protein RecN, partial [Vibrio alfacsensis]